MSESLDGSLLDFSLDGKVALVTGGASGIGAAVVEAYASKGATVVVLDRDLAPAAALMDRTGASGILCDVTEEFSVTEAVAAVVEQFRTIDVLVNSAGVALLSPAEDLEVDAWDQRSRSTCAEPSS
jgi:NADP-dependent 3-hydroxy acid dehydrogenase YdfG